MSIKLNNYLLLQIIISIVLSREANEKEERNLSENVSKVLRIYIFI